MSSAPAADRRPVACSPARWPPPLSCRWRRWRPPGADCWPRSPAPCRRPPCLPCLAACLPCLPCLAACLAACLVCLAACLACLRCVLCRPPPRGDGVERSALRGAVCSVPESRRCAVGSRRVRVGVCPFQESGWRPATRPSRPPRRCGSPAPSCPSEYRPVDERNRRGSGRGWDIAGVENGVARWTDAGVWCPQVRTSAGRASAKLRCESTSNTCLDGGGGSVGSPSGLDN